MLKQAIRYLRIICILIALPIATEEAQFNDRLISPEELQDLLLEAQQEESAIELSPEDLQETRSIQPKTSWTFIIYMAADNDLHPFAWKNLRQLSEIGSNENISIVVQLNTPGYSSPTKRYIIKKGKRLLVQDDYNLNQKLNSGIPSTLIDCASWAISHHPADHYALIFWNHGSGAMDPKYARTINPCDLFYLNPTDNKLEIDRSISYLALICQEAATGISLDNKRGVCFDDTYKSYLSNQDLDIALREICSTCLNGNKLSLVGFDACLMSMIEITSICKKYADYFVASQEIEYGTGWRYDYVLEPFIQSTLTPRQFAQHIVYAYERAYQKVINDYTLSAHDLSLTTNIEENINTVATLLLSALKNQQGHSVADIIRKCKSPQYCTCFDEPSYIDLGHFYTNLLQHVNHLHLKNKSQEQETQALLTAALQSGLQTLNDLIIANKVGTKLKNAHGLSIYFPERTLAQSYPSSPFAQGTQWYYLLTRYIFG